MATPVYTSTTLADASGGALNSVAIPLNRYGSHSVALQVTVTGTANFTVQQTLDNVFDADVTPTWVDHPDANLADATATAQGNYEFAPAAVRLQLNSGTGSAKLTILQEG